MPRRGRDRRVAHLRRGQLSFDVHDRGPLDGEVIVLLHGWPADASSWDDVADPLVERGYRVVAPDQRGYSPGARPSGRRAYRMTELVADVVALLDRIGRDRVHLVGHDWGGAVAWALASAHPERLATLTVLSTPHPQAMVRSFASSWQLLRSAYVAFFQVPAVPEAVLLAGDGAVARRVLERSGLPADRADAYVRRLGEPGALTASLAWYRALPLAAGPAVGDITVSTLYVWSTGDTALGRRAAELTSEHVSSGYRFEELEGISHWIPEEVPEVVATLIVDHIARPA
jgi:pimeloyl-ACP methyl ester carboxylesterase